MQNIRNAASHMPGSSSCWQRNWPRVFLLFALATAVLCFVSIITGLITAVLQPRLVLLSIYCLLFALLGFSAELRQFAWCRRVVYLWMRYFYFLTYYKARAIFYIMFGFLLLTSRTLDIIAAIVTLALGIMMLLVALVVDLPVFEDPREQQQKEEEYRNYYSGPPPNSAAVVNTNAGTNNVNMNTTSNNGVQADTPAQFKSGAANAQHNKQAAVVPPGAAPAQTNHYTDHTYRDSGDDEPAQREGTSTYSNVSPKANPYETNNSDTYAGANMFSSGGRSGPSMFAPSPATQVASPPLQEAGVTRGGNTESAIRRDFAAAVGSSAKGDDIR
ncbi:hypothetical protein ABB37_08475 [Leptomonas pyrrhocoris]|uniref:COPI associated protein n=1 Tax=Leptomonas pyrrhocoris TaxID=157538 RepID=A0A0M9FT83_LEPPY|nr:hypothetical protein ABB37_08475 [Leptomonas pyrrhocoris]KPA75600.1 hypothetical protein ABB37_08475 [Leptomonas pyrrhocoris]|eukprot:XP_015654039.1 hypothetical protein ABB37_08475 [Leptomonas pyrrhocoris]